MAPLTRAQLDLGIASHNNRFLFSDHYLGPILRGTDRWRAAVDAARKLLPWLTALYEKERDQLPHYSESQLEDNWFKPILTRLGHVYEGQPKIPGLDARIKRPDFIFFPDEETRQQAAAQQMSQTYTQHALAVGEVKAWDVPLGKKQKGAPSFDNNNPSYQIDYYLRAAELDWGILSNGRLWRLVHKDTSYKLDVYFEIDLAQAIESQNMAAIAFFACFFEQRAFRPDAGGRPFLADALQASADYALKLEADLRDNAYKALEHLIQGFIEPQANGLSADDLPAIYTNSLYLLYRIIFLFYGEARGLLPIENKAYQGYSITQFARTIAKDLDAGQVAPPMTNQSWARLQQLFTIIAGTQPDLNAYLGVPRYNGGLFNPELHPFLENHFVGDRYLHAAIDAIARREVGEKKAELRRENVDYRTLGVRQLGSIYEGLLEYQPRRATEPMVAVKRKKGEQWIAAAEAKKRAKILDRRDVGAVFLVTDKGERKATGSYYTPDYIVKYIVEQTLGPLVEQARERVKAAGAEGDEAGERFAREILALNVLDPAMGSGHFLVEATDYLARAIATDAYTTVDEAAAPDDDDLVYWRRQVVEACIYGVDKNRMAVELAKLSLWLVTVAKDRPLSFLDHHLRHGDSLVGARLADLAALPSGKRGQTAPDPDQPALLNESALTQDTFRAVGGMMAIETLLSDSIDDLHTKERVLADVRAHLGRWRRIADLWTSSFFGNEMTAAEYRDLLRYLQSAEADGAGMMSAEQRARFLEHPAVIDNDYFHWELEFPEVFFDEFGRALGDAAGFDAVVGNPPWVDVQEIQDELRQYHRLNYAAASGKYDLYVVFMERSVALMSQAASRPGSFGMIVQSKFLATSYGAGVRQVLATEANISRLIDMGDAPIFGEATTYPLIVIATTPVGATTYPKVTVFNPSQRPKEPEYKKLMNMVDGNEVTEVFGTFYAGANAFRTASPWRLESRSERKMWERIRAGCDELSIHVTAMNRSITTGLNSAFVQKREFFRAQGVEDELLQPLVMAGDVKPYYAGVSDQVILFPYHATVDKSIALVNIDEFPGASRYFDRVKTELTQRRWFGQTVLEANIPWRGYLYMSQHILRPKLLFPKIVSRNTFAYDEPGTAILLEPAYIAVLSTPLSPHFMLACMNSKLLTSWLKAETTTLAGDFFEQQVQYVQRLPIPRIEFSLAAERVAALNRQLAFHYDNGEYGAIRALAAANQCASLHIAHTILSYLAIEIRNALLQRSESKEEFALDLEGSVPMSFHRALSGKGKWEQSLAKAGVSPRFVDPESRRTRTLDESLGWDEASFKIFVKLLAKKVPSLADLVKVYRKHAPRYQELTRRIEETDRLIDQIVYQLYGLTDEEIAIVEAATG